MSAEDQEDWIPKEPAVYLKSLSYYKDSLTWTGWPIFFGWEEQRRYVPLWLPYCNPTAVTMLECKRLQRLLRAYFNSETFSFNLDLQNDLVRHVLDIYPYRPLDADRMLDIGQVMHGIAFFCKQHLGVAWVQKVLLLSWNTAERSQLHSLLPDTKLALVVLHDDNHWALFAFLYEHGLAVYYDGQERPLVKSAADAMCAFFSGETKSSVFLARRAKVPPQQDSWSCGQRTLLCANHILDVLVGNAFAMLPLQVPDSEFSADQFIALTRIEAQSGEQVAPPVLGNISDDEHPQEPVRKKNRTGNRAEEDEDNSQKDGKESSKAGKRKKPAEDKKAVLENLQTMEQDLRERLRFSHNVQFQKEHAQRDVFPKKGHWNQFLIAYSANAAMKCEACQACRDWIKKEEQSLTDGNTEAGAPDAHVEAVGAPDAHVEAVDDASDAVPEPAAKKPRAKGRPKKGASIFNLGEWLEQTRKGIYKVVDAKQRTFLCTLCNQNLKLQRDGETFVRLHEKRKLHQAKATLFAHGLETDDGPEAAPGRVPEPTPCMGVKIEDEVCCAPELYKYRDSFANWIAAGMPYVKSQDSSGFSAQQASVSVSADGLVLRHVQCKSENSLGPCHLCYMLSNKDSFIADIKKWSYRLDLVQLAHYLILGTTDEIREQEELIRGRDYFEEFHDKELTKLLKSKNVDAVCRIRSWLLSVPKQKRSPSLQVLIDMRMPNFRDCSPREMDKSIFLTLMNKYRAALEAGECHKEEFQLASLVATGRLRSEPVVEVLFKSVMNKICRQDNGCVSRPGTSKYIDNEMALDLLVVLGRSKASENFLEFLGQQVVHSSAT